MEVLVVVDILLEVFVEVFESWEKVLRLVAYVEGVERRNCD